MNFIYTLINIKNMIKNSIFVRIVWVLIGAYGLAKLMVWNDAKRIELGIEPMFLRDGILCYKPEKEEKEDEDGSKVTEKKTAPKTRKRKVAE